MKVVALPEVEGKNLCAEIQRVGWTKITLEQALAAAPSLEKFLREADAAGLLRGYLALLLHGRGAPSRRRTFSPRRTGIFGAKVPSNMAFRLKQCLAASNNNLEPSNIVRAAETLLDGFKHCSSRSNIVWDR